MRLVFLTLAALGFANAATSFAARAFVVGCPGAARLAGWYGALFAGAFGAALLALCLRGADWITMCFLPTAGAAERDAVHAYLAIAGWSQVLGAMALGAIGAVHGAGRMVAPLCVDLLGFAVLGWMTVYAWIHEKVFGKNPLAGLSQERQLGVGCVVYLALVVLVTAAVFVARALRPPPPEPLPAEAPDEDGP